MFYRAFEKLKGACCSPEDFNKILEPFLSSKFPDITKGYVDWIHFYLAKSYEQDKDEMIESFQRGIITGSVLADRVSSDHMSTGRSITGRSVQRIECRRTKCQADICRPMKC